MPETDCRRNCWISAAIGGVIVLLFKSGIGDMHWLAGAFVGLITFLLLGGLLTWLVCDGRQAPFEPRIKAVPPAPAPQAPLPARGTIDVENTAQMPIMAGATPQAVAAAHVTAPAISALAPVAAPEPRKAEKKTKAEKAAKKAAKAEKPAKDKPAKEKSGKKKAAKALLDQPRGGQADDLKVIKGVGPKIEVWLNENGIWHFDQIAGWDAKDVAFYMDRMGRMGTRIESDEWVAQARALAATGKVY